MALYWATEEPRQGPSRGAALGFLGGVMFWITLGLVLFS